VKRIQDGIYQIITPFPEYERKEAYRLREEREAHPRVTRGLPYVLPYFIASRGDSLLVDCGWNTEDAYAALVEQLHDAGAQLGDVRNLVLTHAHPDHCGLAGRLKKETGCTIWIHELEAAVIQSRYVDPDELLDRMDVWYTRHGVSSEDRPELERGSMPMRFFVAPFEADRPLRGGEELRAGDYFFQLVWTPGHSPGHICLYEPNYELLISGDHILPLITPNVSLHPQQRENPLQDFLESIETVARLKVKRTLPAHEWDFADFQKRIEMLRVHHLSRLEDMIEAVGREGPVTAMQVAQRVKWATGSYESFPAWMKRAAIGEALSHLVYLVRQGRLQMQEEEGLVQFQAVA
jgi:glyoxylase-like metal-dependent hydrolase (beta-lactamase superfamily II)